MAAGQIMVRVYRAKRQDRAAQDFQRDASLLAADGWEVVSQSWADGRSGCLRLLFMGFVFAMVIKPAGSLTVTYRLPAPAEQPTDQSVTPTTRR